MNSDYSIYKLKENDFKILIPLMQDCFGMEVNINYFEWKFKDNPAGFVEGYYAKHTNGEIAAYYGVIPQSYSIQGHKRIIYQSCDTMTHSNHRRQGLFKKLALHCYDSLKNEDKLFVIGFGGGQSTPGFIKFGWKEVFKTRNYFYPVQFKYLQFLNFKEVDEITDYKKIDTLLTLSNSNANIHSIKTVDYFKWRVSNPLYNYKTVATKVGSKEYDSYITYYEYEKKLFVFDFHIDNPISGKNLFNFLKSKLNSTHKGIITFVQEESVYSNTIKKYGFVANPFKRGPLHETVPFIFYATQEEMTLLNDSQNWQINSYDHDAL